MPMCYNCVFFVVYFVLQLIICFLRLIILSFFAVQRYDFFNSESGTRFVKGQMSKVKGQMTSDHFSSEFKDF